MRESLISTAQVSGGLSITEYVRDLATAGVGTTLPQQLAALGEPWHIDGFPQALRFQRAYTFDDFAISASTPMGIGLRAQITEQPPDRDAIDELMDWLAIHPEVLAPYPGEWVVFDGRHIVGHAALFSDATQIARDANVAEPFLMPGPSRETRIRSHPVLGR